MHRCSPTPRAVRAILLPAALAATMFGPSGSADAQIAYKSTLHKEYQAVDSDGASAWPEGSVPPYPIEMTGVVINNPWDMLYYWGTPDDWPAFDPDGPYDEESPQWQVYS